METWRQLGWLFLLIYKGSAVGVNLLWNSPASNENTVRKYETLVHSVELSGTKKNMKRQASQQIMLSEQEWYKR